MAATVREPGVDIEAVVKRMVDSRLEEIAGLRRLTEELQRLIQEGQLRRLVEKGQMLIEEGQKLHNIMRNCLQRYAEETPRAQRIVEQLSHHPPLQSSHLHYCNEDAPDDHSRPAQVLYRNIKCAGSKATYDDHRLVVYEAHNENAPRRGSLEFGALLPVAATVQQDPVAVAAAMPPDKTLWLQLAHGAASSGLDLQGCWVQARLADGTVQCAQVTGEGRPEEEEYSGQDFGRFYTEGFDGPRDAVVLSASGQAFWPTLNLTCMLRGVAMATVFERDWADTSEGFAAWVPYYAVNVFRFGLAGGKKRMFVTVKPTANWRRYAGPEGTWVHDAENAKGDIGHAQYLECRWLHGMSRKLGFAFEHITFVTALSFLRAQCGWTEDQCILESLLELEKAHKDFQSLDEDEMEKVFFAQLFSTEEALGFDNLQAVLGVDGAFRKTALDPVNPVPWPKVPSPTPEQAGRACKFLRDMLEVWRSSKMSYLQALNNLGLQPADLTDVGILTNYHRNVLHGVAKGGQCRVLRTVLEELRKGKVLRDWLVRMNPEGQTPLHVALDAGRQEAAAILVKEVTDSGQLEELLKVVDMSGNSPMHLAAAKGNEEAMQSFLIAGGRDWVTEELLSKPNSVKKTTLLDLCLHQEAVLQELLSVGIEFKKVRRWLVGQLKGVSAGAGGAQIVGRLGRLLHQVDRQGCKFIACFEVEERKEVLRALGGAELRAGSLCSFRRFFSEATEANEQQFTVELLEAAEATEVRPNGSGNKKVLQDLIAHALVPGLSRLLDYGLRPDANKWIAIKVLATIRSKNCLHEVLQDLVVHGAQPTLVALLRVAAATRGDWVIRAVPVDFELQEAMDDALLGAMLQRLHEKWGCLESEMPTALSSTVSPKPLSRLLRVVLVHFTDRRFLREFVDLLLKGLLRTDPRPEVLENLTANLPIRGLSLLAEWGVRNNHGIIVEKTLRAGRRTGPLVEVLRDLVQFGTQYTLNELLKQSLAAGTPGGRGREPAAFQLQLALDEAADDALLGKLLRSCWDHSGLKALKTSSPERSGRLLHAALVCFEDEKPILLQLLDVFLPAMERDGHLQQVLLKCLTPQGLGQVLCAELCKDKSTVAPAAVSAVCARGCLDEVMDYTSKTASVGTLKALVRSLLAFDGDDSLQALVQALHKVGYLHQVVWAGSQTDIERMLRNSEDSTLGDLAGAVCAMGRFEEVVEKAALSALQALRLQTRPGPRPRPSAVVEDQTQTLSDLIVDLHRDGLFQEVVQKSHPRDLCYTVIFARRNYNHYSCEGETLLRDLDRALQGTRKSDEVERRVQRMLGAGVISSRLDSDTESEELVPDRD